MKTMFSTADGHDLWTVFEHRATHHAPVAPTGFRVQDGRDLADLFAPYDGGQKVNPVGFCVADGRDLCEIFAAHPDYRKGV
jgi:hypothetical protein